MFKCSDISLNDVCTYEVTSTSIASQGFRYLVAEALRNFANIVYTGTDWPYQDAKDLLFDNKITSNINAKRILKENFRTFTSDKVNYYYFVSINYLKYNKTEHEKCVEYRDVTLLKCFRKRYVEIRNNDNAIISRTKNKLIIGSPLMALDKLDFVAKKVETISISQRKFANACYKKECQDNGGLFDYPDKNVSEFFIEDVEAISDKCFDDNKVSKNCLSQLILKEFCQNMRKYWVILDKKGNTIFSIVDSSYYCSEG